MRFGLVARIRSVIKEISSGGGLGWCKDSLDVLGIGDPIIDNIFILGLKIWLVIMRGGILI